MAAWQMSYRVRSGVVCANCAEGWGSPRRNWRRAPTFTGITSAVSSAANATLALLPSVAWPAPFACPSRSFLSRFDKSRDRLGARRPHRQRATLGIVAQPWPRRNTMTTSLEIPVGTASSSLPETPLWTSTRMWRDRVDGQWVLYAPDKRGLPVVVSQSVAEILERCEAGATFATIAESARAGELTLNPEQALAVTEFLVKQSFLRHERDHARYEARDAAGSQPDTFSVWLHINNHCNLDCSYCFVDKSQAEMSDEVMDRTVEYLANTVSTRGIKNFTLKFAGGEPTLSVPRMEAFSEKLERALEGVDCTWFTSVLSNGTVMSERLIRFLRRPRTGISISIDGYGPAGHDIYRVFKGSQRGSWDIIQANIAKALENGIVPYILATISQESSKTLPALVRWIFGQGLKARLSVVRQPESTEAYSVFRLNGSRRTIEDEYRELIATVNAAFEEAFRELANDSYVIDLRSALSICELHFDTPSFGSCCGIGSNHVVINEKGELASCPMTVHRDTVPMTPDVLQSVPLTFGKYAPTDRELNHGKSCLDCKWFPVCVSGCPINNLAVNGRPYSVSPLHSFYEYVIPRYLQFFARKLLQAARRRDLNEFLVLTA